MDTSRFRDDSGLSLTELLVVSVLISVILRRRTSSLGRPQA